MIYASNYYAGRPGQDAGTLFACLVSPIVLTGYTHTLSVCTPVCMYSMCVYSGARCLMTFDILVGEGVDQVHTSLDLCNKTQWRQTDSWILRISTY